MDPKNIQWLETPDPGCTPAELPFLALEDTFVSGDRSDHRLSIRYYRRNEDGALIGKVFFGPGTQGPPDHAHGGSMAALLDEAMGGAAWLAGHPVVAAQLNIKFSTMLPLETPCLVEAEVVGVEGRKIRTRGVLRDMSGQNTFCEGEALFITLDKGKIGQLSAKAQIIVDRMRQKNSDPKP
ncbi:MAG: PaaI family thioesterase [Gemmatimonadales bacterium]|nr:PaaI family thioesterase [Gemmatimonadales bacterium]